MAEFQDLSEERTDENRRSDLVSKADVKKFLVGLVVVAVVLSPIFFYLRENAYRATCGKNLLQLYKGITLYAAENNDRLPPVYVTSQTDAPYIERGAANTWVQLIEGQTKESVSTVCQSAGAEDRVMVHSESGSRGLTYGMFAPLGGEPMDLIDNPDQAVLLGETANMGASGTYDPMPFKDASGEVVPYDGFVIGFNDSNLLPTDASKAVTRLAFPDTADGQFKLDGRTRHRDGIQIVTASGRLRTIKPDMAYLKLGGAENPLWKIAKTRRYRR